MTEDDVSRQELDARTDESHRIGTDLQGRHHYLSTNLTRIWVVDDGEIVHVEATSRVSAWVDHIRAEVGWQDCNYSGESLAEALASAFTGGAA
jgi:hypothetical protein